MSSIMLWPRPGFRDRTTTVHVQAVERVIQTMRERLDDNLSLQDLSDAALASPYHLNRIFRQTTGIPPFTFLAALRMEAAKRLLLTTSLSVTEVCCEVGYSSVGTFTSHFSRFVGLSPRQMRRFAEQDMMISWSPEISKSIEPYYFGLSSPGVVGS